MNCEEQYVILRDEVIAKIDELFTKGEECGYTPDMVTDEITDHLYNEHPVN